MQKKNFIHSIFFFFEKLNMPSPWKITALRGATGTTGTSICPRLWNLTFLQLPVGRHDERSRSECVKCAMWFGFQVKMPRYFLLIYLIQFAATAGQLSHSFWNVTVVNLWFFFFEKCKWRDVLKRAAKWGKMAGMARRGCQMGTEVHRTVRI